MATSADNSTGLFAPLAGIFAAAAATSTGVFLLFSSFLTDVVPPFEESRQTVAFATFGTALVLLALALVLQKRLTGVTATRLAKIGGLLVVGATVLFLYSHQIARTYVYRYPPASIANEQQARHIRGELHERGRQLVGGMTVAQAVYQLGGPDQVNALGTLWSEDSRLAVITRMEVVYILLALFMTTAFSALGIAIWRQRM